MKIITLNCNGIRAAQKKGLFEWLATTQADIIKLQEVRADLSILEKICQLADYTAIHNPAEKKGYSGTAILSLKKPENYNFTINNDIIDSEGRWCEITFPQCRFISLYLPSGSSGEEAQKRKDTILPIVAEKLNDFLQESQSGKQTLISGDWNIAHSEKDIKNWRGNLKNSGFLPHERQWISDLLSKGWTDVFRNLHPNAEGQGYSWWSNRGNAWQNNTGWRIDYQIATPKITQTAQSAEVYKKQRFSDHSPVIINYDYSI